MSDARADIPFSHWNLLFAAVQSRLHVALDDAPEPTGAAPRFKTVVGECLQALDQLHASLGSELQRCSDLEQALADARAELADARRQLDSARVTERRAVHRSQHDELTQLANRLHFRERLAATLVANGAAPSAQAEEPAPKAGPAFAVLFIDLDNFKHVNDLHGHATGDELLRIVGARLAGSARAGDLIGRIGGDEFGYLIAARPERATLVALVQRLLHTLSEPVEIGQLLLRVKPSIGVSICPDDGQTSDRLLEQADAAMYHAKRSGIGYAFVDDCRAL